MLVQISPIVKMVQTALLLVVGICIKYSNEALITKACKKVLEPRWGLYIVIIRDAYFESDRLSQSHHWFH